MGERPAHPAGTNNVEVRPGTYSGDFAQLTVIGPGFTLTNIDNLTFDAWEYHLERGSMGQRRDERGFAVGYLLSRIIVGYRLQPPQA